MLLYKPNAVLGIRSRSHFFYQCLCSGRQNEIAMNLVCCAGQLCFCRMIFLIFPRLQELYNLVFILLLANLLYLLNPSWSGAELESTVHVALPKLPIN